MVYNWNIKHCYEQICVDAIIVKVVVRTYLFINVYFKNINGIKWSAETNVEWSTLGFNFVC